MKIVAWNVWWGGGVRSGSIAAELISRNPDVIVLSEYQPFASASLLVALAAEGWTEHALTTPPGRYGGVAVLAKTRIESLPVTEPLKPFEHRYVSVSLPSHNMEVRAVYAPLHKDPFAEFWGGVLGDLREAKDRPVLVVGDFNSGLSAIDSPSTDVFCSNFFSQIPGCGYRDLWRERHGPDAREYTWLGPVNPYRLDHAFGTASLADRVTECAYDHSVRAPDRSDHSLLWLEVD